MTDEDIMEQVEEAKKRWIRVGIEQAVKNYQERLHSAISNRGEENLHDIVNEVANMILEDEDE